MNISTTIANILSNNQVTGTIASVILLTLIGYFLTVIKVFTTAFEQQLTKLILTLSVPALSFASFLQPLNHQLLHEGIAVIVWGFLLYIALLVVSPLAYFFLRDRFKRKILSIITSFGSTTIFGLPIAGAIYGAKGIIYASLFNIAYRLLLYTYVYIVMANNQLQQGTLRQIFLNPIVIATLLGLLCWLTQDWLPHLIINHRSVALFRIDQTAPWLYTPLRYLADLTAPLSWLVIGCTLGKIHFRQIILDKLAWYYAAIKSLLVPLACLALLLLSQHYQILAISSTAIATAVLLMSSPTSTIPVAYSIRYNCFPELTAKCSMLSNISSIIVLPLWIAILSFLH
ncbi:AEC family transporter [Lactiplantibacillus plantarum]|uniref:AEC family transporter n=1 Tax=Lactiplantibacillus plantarum TaxID=1590 RepID=UPI001E4EABC9|nr:AEC family transporter [Lactiplantibacillus plantarum]MCC6117810.1 AEC family transporter [Lactiplantibacillus plantarum]MCW6115357.1 AEC family transporter [Lactiplantibacillus plantarum]